MPAFSQLTIDLIETSGTRYLKARDALTDSWHGRCGCQSPGLKLKCQVCPYFKEYIELLQLKIELPSSQSDFAVVLPPKLAPPYGEEIKQRCIEMFRLKYSIKRIQQLTGINSSQTIRNWLREVGLYKNAQEYSTEQKQECLDLYRQGKTPLEIESLTDVPTDIISAWTTRTGIARLKKHYSLEQQQQAVVLYGRGVAYAEIESLTGVPKSMVQKFASHAKVRRKRVGRTPTYTPEFKQKCFALLEQGQKPCQIEELLGVSADTVRKWWKKHQKELDITQQ